MEYVFTALSVAAGVLMADGIVSAYISMKAKRARNAQLARLEAFAARAQAQQAQAAQETVDA